MSNGEANYYAAFISVADDCPAQTGEEPRPARGRVTPAQLHLQMARDEAGSHTQAQILFRTHLNAQGLDPADHPEGEETWQAFFSKGQPCLRTSPLAKRYGWGLLFDEAGRVSAVPVDSPEYRRLAADPELRQLKAMRSSRG